MEILRFKNFSEIILEKSIGSEEIRKKWYSDLDKKEFYKLVNIDPTSIRKKDFSKPLFLFRANINSNSFSVSLTLILLFAIILLFESIS